MVAWIVLVIAAVGVGLLVALPGTLLLAGAGTGRPLALAAGPVVTVAIVGVATVLFSLLGLKWNPWSAGGLLLFIGGVGAAAMLIRRKWLSTPHRQATAHSFADTSVGVREVLASIAGVITAGGVQIALLAKAIGTPYTLLQNTDAMVQLNLIEEIRRSGDASMLTAAVPVTGGTYPTVWHAFSVFLAPFAGTPFVFNAMVVTLFAVLFPSGMGMLVATAGRGPAARIAAPWLALSLPWFPGFMLTFNAQVSGAFAVALIPFALTAVVLLWRRTLDWRALLLGIVIVLGVGLASPGAGQWAVEVGCLLLFMRLLPRVRGLRRRSGRVGAIIGLTLASSLPLFAMMGMPTLRVMGSFERGHDPLWSRLLTPLLLNDVVGTVSPVPIALWMCLPLSILGVVGLVLVRRSGAQVLTASLAVTVLCVWITGLPKGPWWALVGGWWRDYPRFLTLEVIILAFFGALALDAFGGWLQRELLRPGRSATVRRVARPAAGTVVLMLILVMCVSNTITFRQLAARGYVYLIHPPWVTSQEAQRMTVVGEELPADAVVYGFPQSGAGLIPVLTPATSVHRSWSPSSTPDERLVAERFDAISTDPQVCDAIGRIGGTPYYYEDSDISDLERWMYFPGYDDVDLSAGFELVATLDTARLYRVTACD